MRLPLPQSAPLRLAAEGSAEPKVKPEIVVTGARLDDGIVNAPNTSVVVDADTIRTRANAVSVETRSGMCRA